MFERIDAASEQGGSTLLIRGPAGIGKSSLLEAARAHALVRRFQILATTGVESESHLAFAGLHQLLRPVFDGVDRLPDAYGTALRSAFGLSEGTNQNPFQIALAVLELLGNSSESAPIMLLVDDLQWLDRTTTDALAFVGRRLEADPIVMLAVLRDGFESPMQGVRLSELKVEGLSDSEAATLLDERAPKLNGALRDRILRESAGNPLALIELSLAIAGGTDDAQLPEKLPLTDRLERTFADRLSSLAPETRSLLHVAATDESSVLEELLSVASKLVGHEVTLEAVAEARNACLVDIDGHHLRFRHPLMRSAIHQVMSLRERQAAHAALAAMLVDDPDRSVWHRAAAVLGSNEQIAAELESAGLRAERRGALGVSLEARQRAAELTDDPARRGTRLIHAAYFAGTLGRHRDVLRLLERINDQELRPIDLPHARWLREIYAEGTWSGPSMIASFVEIAEQKRIRGEYSLGLSTLNDIALRCWWSNPDDEIRSALIAVAERFPVPEDDVRLLAVLALGDPVERGAIVLDRLSRLPTELHADQGWQGSFLGLAAMATGDFVRAERFFESNILFCRSHGMLGMLAATLVSQAWTKIARGDWRSAGSVASEAARLTEETAHGPYWTAAANLAGATIAAYRGQSDVAEEIVRAAEQVFLPRGANSMLALVQYPRGAAALATGRYDEAYQHLRRIFDPSDSAFHPHVRSWTLVDLIEAAVLSGHENEAATFVNELEPIASRSRSPILDSALRFARPVLSGGDDMAFQAGTELAPWPFTRARLQLAHGIWLRRQRRPADARTPLRAARDAFDALGAAPWGERARQELRASGETSRQRSYELADSLSPQELQIAQLAAAGMTNKEIGRQLFLSHRTVSSHLYKVFPKLGITARSQLRAALQDQFSE